MKKTEGKNASIFELNGVPQLSKALPLALQHVVAMIVGCVTPAIIVAGVAGLEGANRYADSVCTGSFRTFHIFTAVSDRTEKRLPHGGRITGYYGNQFCICGKYAGDCGRYRYCGDIWSTDHRWYHCDDHWIFY